MKKFKNFPYYFLFVLIIFIISQKYNLVIRGTPIGGYSWRQIWRQLPYTTIWTSIWAFIITKGMNDINKKEKENVIEAKKRIAEREINHSSPNTHECRVCGYYSDDFPWGEDGKSPSYQLCPCCGVQFGKEDSTLECVRKYRVEWERNGRKWFVEDEKPELWNIDAQMKNIPNEFS